MPKGKRGKPPEDKPTATSEVIQFRPPINAIQVVGAKDADLPAVDLSHMDPAEAVKVLIEVTALNERAVIAAKEYEKARDEAKQRKAKWEELSEQVQSRLKELTHPAALPLFDERKAEEDLTRIQEAAASAPDPAHVLADSQIPF